MTRLTQIKKQITLVREIERITNTMKTISAVRLRMGKGTLERAGAFLQHLERILGLIGPLERPTEGERLLVGIFPDRGLVGGFSDILGQEIFRFLRDSDFQKTKIIILGNQGKRVIQNWSENILAVHPLSVHRVPHYHDVRSLTYTIFNKYKQGEFSQIFVSFMRYVSVSQHHPVVERVLPPPETDNISFRENYLFLSEVKNLYHSLLFEYLAGKLYKSIAESFLSEQATRFLLMDSATTHARETIRALSLLYAKKRQEKITQDLNEVTSASEVLQKPLGEDHNG